MLLSLTLAGCVSLGYSAKSITTRAVDAQTKKPIEGVIAVAYWGLDTENGTAAELMVLETVTDSSGVCGYEPNAAGNADHRQQSWQLRGGLEGEAPEGEMMMMDAVTDQTDTSHFTYASLAASFSPLQRSLASGEAAEYAVNRTISGVNQIVLIYMIKGSDGIWRLESL